MIPATAVHPPEVQALHAPCHHMPMNNNCEACKFRAAAGAAYIVNACTAAIASLGSTP